MVDWKDRRISNALGILLISDDSQIEVIDSLLVIAGWHPATVSLEGGGELFLKQKTRISKE